MINRIFKCILVLLIIPLSLYMLELIKFECIYRKLFNIYCAGCGFTRMIRSIFDLDFYQAFRYNPLLFILLILFISYIIYEIYIYIKTGSIKKPSIRVLIVLVIILFIYMIIRNIPYFNYLIPTKIK